MCSKTPSGIARRNKRANLLLYYQNLFESNSALITQGNWLKCEERNFVANWWKIAIIEENDVQNLLNLIERFHWDLMSCIRDLLFNKLHQLRHKISLDCTILQEFSKIFHSLRSLVYVITKFWKNLLSQYLTFSYEIDLEILLLKVCRKFNFKKMTQSRHSGTLRISMDGSYVLQF